MNSPVTRTPLAVKDVEEIAEYLRQEAGLTVALRFIAGAEEACQALAANPRIGATLGLPGAEADIRRWHIDGFDSHLILYRPTDSGVEIVRVLHAARDLEALLGDEPY